jgi:hypothetical protein
MHLLISSTERVEGTWREDLSKEAVSFFCLLDILNKAGNIEEMGEITKGSAPFTVSTKWVRSYGELIPDVTKETFTEAVEYAKQAKPGTVATITNKYQKRLVAIDLT